MELSGDTLELERELSELDREVIEFCDILEDIGLDYVIVSGYVAILTGRSRGTEDIDIIIQEDKTRELIQELEERGYWCINEELEAISELLNENLSPRIAKKGEVIPNFELACPQDSYDRASLENSIKAELGSSKIKISPLELQIAYKLYLGSQKDMEDAKHLYQLFKNKLDEKELREYAEEMNKGDELDEL